MSPSAFRRLTAMDRTQAAFRLRGEVRKLFERTAAAISPPRWNRRDLALRMREMPLAADWARAHAAIVRGNFGEAQIALGRHFAQRKSAFPLDASDVGRCALAITKAFPNAAGEAAGRADALTRGDYDLLGYRGISVGTSIDWHADPVSGRHAPLAHWASVRYLNPAYGDHKVIWEFNRHQHWLALGRGYALTGTKEYYHAFRHQLESWIQSNPPTTGINWASMLELAFRTMSWLWAFGFFSTATQDDGSTEQPWLVDALLAMSLQLDHIERNLSLYFSPNTHLTGEALALYVAGCALPELNSSHRWARVGRDVLVREAHAQILSDGAHAELSGHYHRYSTEFYLLALSVARAAGDPAAAVFEQAARKQSRYLRIITDDSGRRPATGDDDGGQLFPICRRSADDCTDTLAVAAILLNEPDLAISRAPEEAYWWCGEEAARLASPPRIDRRRSAALRDSGYAVSRTARGDYLLFDAGPHGFLNAGHAHADALALILTVAGRPLLIDPGTATYTMDARIRDRFRSTAMHNTVVLDDRSQSEPAGPFHWKTRATAHLRVWRSSPPTPAAGADYVEGAHDGYSPRQHIRSVLTIDEVGWWIVDTIVGEGSCEAANYWHLHPAWHANVRDGHVLLHHSDGMSLALATNGDATVAQPGQSPLAFWSPEYGRVEPSSTIAVHTLGNLPLTIGTFIPADSSFIKNLKLRSVRVSGSPGRWLRSGWQASWDGGEVFLVLAVSVDDARHGTVWSPTVWGSDELVTDGRIASVVRMPGRDCAIVIDGSSVNLANVPVVAAELQTEILRVPVPDMAQLLHEQDGAARAH